VIPPPAAAPICTIIAGLPEVTLRILAWYVTFPDLVFVDGVVIMNVVVATVPGEEIVALFLPSKGAITNVTPLRLVS
jgi:hypothetical protein